MSTFASKSARDTPGSTLVALAFSLAGWTLMAIWLIQVHAGLTPQIFTSAIGLSLTWLSVRHLKLRGLNLRENGGNLRTYQRDTAANAGWATVPFLAGVAVGCATLYADLPLLAIVSGVVFLAPWSRIPRWREHLITSCVLMYAGTTLPLVVGYRLASPIFPPLATWVLWIWAMFAVVRSTVHLIQAERGDYAKSRAPSA